MRRIRSTDEGPGKDWKEAVLARTDYRSALSGMPAECAHHIVYQQHLRARAKELEVAYETLRWDKRNGMALTDWEHRRHHNRIQPILREELPRCVFEFAEQWGLLVKLERYYPEALEEAA